MIVLSIMLVVFMRYVSDSIKYYACGIHVVSDGISFVHVVFMC